MAKPSLRTASCKSTFTGQLEETEVPCRLERWDGAKRTSSHWQASQKDHDLWIRSGNCSVYLYHKGESQRGPSFRVPMSALMTTKCYRFIGRHAVAQGQTLRTGADIRQWYQQDPTRSVELYAGGNPLWDNAQMLRHQLSIRNLLAWALWKPVVGETLGGALVGLLQSMYAFRPASADNIADFTNFVEEQGYLHLASQPEYSVAMLGVAEAFHMQDLYLKSLGHCAAMGKRLFNTRGYHRLSAKTQMAINRAQLEVAERMARTETMLGTFLQCELSRSHTEVPIAIRAHLDRFRQFLISFYNQKLGRYPPASFNGMTYRVMAEDFDSLYNLLVDKSQGAKDTRLDLYAPTWETMTTFSAVDEFDPILYLPLLPKARRERSLLSSWLARVESRQPDDSLAMASNWDDGLFENDLVRAYQKFEEECLMGRKKADRQEKLSAADGRRARWMLICGVQQALLYATQRPKGIADDLDAPYVVTISSDTTLPWLDPGNEKAAVARSNSLPARAAMRDDKPIRGSHAAVDIRPDMDYLTLTRVGPPLVEPEAPGISWRPSLARSSTRADLGSKVRRSMSLFRLNRANTVSVPVSVRPQPYHEIVVRGYGNGTKQVVHTESATSSLASRNASTASDSKSRDSVSSSAGSTDATEPDACDTTTDIMAEVQTYVQPLAGPQPPPIRRRWSHQPDKMPIDGPGRGGSVSRRRSLHAAVDKMMGLAQGSQTDVRRRNSRRFSFVTIQDAVPEEPSADVDVDVDGGDWAAMDAFFEGRRGTTGMEQYADLGGLTEMSR